jgi:hypothetical protein
MTALRHSVRDVGDSPDDAVKCARVRRFVCAKRTGDSRYKLHQLDLLEILSAREEFGSLHISKAFWSTFAHASAL